MNAFSLASGLCASAAGAVLLYAAAGKSRGFGEFEQVLHHTAPRLMRIGTVRRVVARGVVGLEAVLALLLLGSSGPVLRATGVAATVVTAAFIPIVIAARRHRRPCGCMGRRSTTPVSRSRVVFNVALVAISSAATIGPSRGVVERAVAAAGAVLAIVVAFAWAAARARPIGAPGGDTVAWAGPVHTRRSFLGRLVGLASAAVGIGLVSDVVRPLRAYACDFWKYSVATPNPAQVGQVVTFTAPYTSTSSGDTIPVTVQWGDGGIDTFIVTRSFSGTFTQTHVYGAAGNFQIVADFQDVIGATTTADVTVLPTSQADQCEMAYTACDQCADLFTQQCLADAEENYRLCLLNASTPADVAACQAALDSAHTACIETGANASNCCVDCLAACDERADQCALGACVSCWTLPPI